MSDDTQCGHGETGVPHGLLVGVRSDVYLWRTMQPHASCQH